MKTTATLTAIVLTAMTLGACNKADAPVNPSEGTPSSSGGTSSSQPLNVEEKKALAASKEELQEGVKTLAAAGVDAEASFDASRVDAYDLDALGKSKADVLRVLGVVPAQVLQAMAEIAQDADYNEAFQKIRTIKFVPADAARGEGFDYESTAKLEGATLTVSYAPLTSMHGGYERSIKACF